MLENVAHQVKIGFIVAGEKNKRRIIDHHIRVAVGGRWRCWPFLDMRGVALLRLRLSVTCLLGYSTSVLGGLVVIGFRKDDLGSHASATSFQSPIVTILRQGDEQADHEQLNEANGMAPVDVARSHGRQPGRRKTVETSMAVQKCSCATPAAPRTRIRSIPHTFRDRAEQRHDDERRSK